MRSAQCVAKTREGTLCQLAPGKDGKYCHIHARQRREVRIFRVAGFLAAFGVVLAAFSNVAQIAQWLEFKPLDLLRSLASGTPPVNARSVASSPQESPTAMAVPQYRLSEHIRFEDGFDAGELAGWRVIQGEWKVLDGTLETIINNRFTRSDIEAGSPDWTNYSLEAEIRYTRGGDEEIRVRYGPNGHYAIGIQHNAGTENILLGVAKEGDGGWLRTTPVKLPPFVWHHVRIDVYEYDVRVFLNAREVITYRDDTRVAHNGGIRLSAWSGAIGQSRASFRNVRVRDILGPS